MIIYIFFKLIYFGHYLIFNQFYIPLVLSKLLNYHKILLTHQNFYSSPNH